MSPMSAPLAAALAAVAGLAGAAGLAGCAHTQGQQASNPRRYCYVESGWLDSSNGCSARAGYPDCYEVCPQAGTKKPVGNVAPTSQ